MTPIERLLIEKAESAQKNAYSPYSSFCVGVALLSSEGEVFTGANVENSSFGGTICAERAAFVAAISAGKRKFDAIAIVGGRRDEEISSFCYPCGICRQFMAEFCSGNFKVLLYDGKETVNRTLDALLPEAFDLNEDKNG